MKHSAGVTMEILLAVFLLLASFIGQGLCVAVVDDLEELYVKPTEPETECPPGNSLCYSLQEYADKSNFTSNRMFLFLEGKHHLDGLVNISDVANLSLVGESSGVEILCISIPSGIQVKNFARLIIEKMVKFR